MKTLREVFNSISVSETYGDFEISISSISLNSKKIESGSLFIALSGNISDGHAYIDQAIAGGARAILCEKFPENFVDGVTYIRVEDTHTALGLIASAFYDHPSHKLKLVGVTGTNGKTTVATLCYQLFRNLGYKAGMIGTVINKINDLSIESERTTPDPITLNELFKKMVDDGCEYCFMEVSSHSVSEKRIVGLSFTGGIFTNLTLDHLDYHKTFDAYRDAKRGFFDMLGENAFAISNKDSDNGKYMLSRTNAKKYFYSLTSDADFTNRLETKLIGTFNQYNMLAVYATACILGQDPEKVKEEIKTLDPVPGRFQYIKSKSGITGIVDYSHTPDALLNVLETIKGMKGNGRIISVFGCGGDRDKSKRPVMAKIGYDASDILILTSDNPRTEDPEIILEEMKQGIEDLPNEKVHIIVDRAQAIKQAGEIAQLGDYILLAGKGHETYQEINGVKSHFDDMEELQKVFNL